MESNNDLLIDDNHIVFIPYNVPSSKNSKIATSRGVFCSKLVKTYLRSLGIKRYSVTKRTIEYYKGANNAFPVQDLKRLFNGKDSPAVVGIHFVRKDARKFDFHNISQIIFDLLVASEVIHDDNMDFIIPVPMILDNKYYSINKEEPGVFIKVFNNEIKKDQKQ